MSNNAAALAEITAQVSTCTLCRLHENAKNPVPGAGSATAEIMFIGEGPGYYEDQQGLPFVGRSGDYLNKLLKMIGLKREDVFITNIVKHRPPENRDPMPDEIAACQHYLDQQIRIIDPLVIATLGRHSMARYFPNGKITQIHGKPKFENGRAYYPFFHPAAVLRNPSLEPAMEEDFRRLLDVLAQVKAMRAENSPSATGGASDGGAAGIPPTQLSLF